MSVMGIMSKGSLSLYSRPYTERHSWSLCLLETGATVMSAALCTERALAGTLSCALTANAARG